LIVNNGNHLDAVVKLVENGVARRRVYVKSNSTLAVDGIGVGSYHVIFELGLDWDGRKFQRNPSFIAFDDDFDFDETPQVGRIEYVEQSITLNPVLNGNAHTHQISEAEFEAAR
jgi:hypothetical protein